MKKLIVTLTLIISISLSSLSAMAGTDRILEPDTFKRYIDRFNLTDNELYRQYIPNDSAWEFLKGNIPFFQCPDKEVETTYYFRWWTYRKHIKQTPTGFIITEFLPDVRWAGKYNSISCPAANHFYEGRWLADNSYLNHYARFWFTEGNPRAYSFWPANALLEYYRVTGDSIAMTLLPDLVANYHEWEKGWIGRGVFIGQNSDGLFSMKDTLDGMEFQIGGSGKRPTINSYMYGEAMAIAELASMTGNNAIHDEFTQKAKGLKQLVETRLWDEKATFFKTISEKTDSLVDVRELQGYTPWYMNLPSDSAGFERAWEFLLRDDGFRAPYGPTTAEQSHPGFQLSYRKGCMWDGRTWPFATGITLTAMANLLNNYHQDIITPSDYFDEFVKFSRSQRITDENGITYPWIDESQHPYTGDWMTRTFLKQKAETEGTDFIERGKDYNHSSYCDLLISGLIGIRPQADNSIVINPLIPDKIWEWFCLDRVLYKGHYITVVYDRYGTMYNLGQGMLIFVDNELRSHTTTIGKVHLNL